jgi:NADPH:quinone reductase-like Zn-dependent oxidoreductase
MNLLPTITSSGTDAILELTEGHGADIVLNTVGGAANAAALRALAWRRGMVNFDFGYRQASRLAL